MHTENWWLRHNQHLYHTDTSQATGYITFSGQYCHPSNEGRSDASCKGQPADTDHSPVLWLSCTSRQSWPASHANSCIWLRTCITMVQYTISEYELGLIHTLQCPSQSGAEELTMITLAVALKVSEAENDNDTVNNQRLGHGLGIQTFGSTALNNLLTGMEYVIPFTLLIGECIGLLGATVKDITWVSPGNTDPSAGYN